jgi:hypothetical protein
MPAAAMIDYVNPRLVPGHAGYAAAKTAVDDAQTVTEALNAVGAFAVGAVYRTTAEADEARAEVNLLSASVHQAILAALKSALDRNAAAKVEPWVEDPMVHVRVWEDAWGTHVEIHAPNRMGRPI